MEANPHLDAIKADPALSSVLDTVGAKLRTLNPTQVEKLVFYLKAAHSYYPKNENHVAYWNEFTDKLESLRNAAEQIELQKRASWQIILGIACCVTAGTLIAPTFKFLSDLADHIGSILCLVIAFGLIAVSDLKFFKRAIVIAKEQDRKYFLASIRTAQTCNELDWAGLFTYSTSAKAGPQSNADVQRAGEAVAELTKSLRAALYNDEFFDYSGNELKRDLSSGA